MRLIDADELKESLKDLKAEGYNQIYVQGLQDAIDYYFPQIIDDMPTVDVQPVKHGRWEQISQNKFTGAKTLRCTYCKNYFVIRDDTLNAGRGDANFCPLCGCKQDLDGDSE